MKRIFDIVLATIILLLFMPFGVVIGFIIILTSRGGVFYRQKRVGRNGKPFRLLKFRTMRLNAEASGQLTVGMKDPRITKVGYFLRKSKLDEFPQFLNVFLGDMSIVGPRPEVPKYVDLYTEEQREVLQVKPGITDYASIEYFRENEVLGQAENPEKVYIEEVMPAKIELNKRYLENPGLLQDIKVIWLTFLKVINLR